MDRFVRGGGRFVTRLASFWEPPELHGRVSWRRTPPVAPRQPGGVGLGLGMGLGLRVGGNTSGLCLCRGKSTLWGNVFHSHSSPLSGF